MGVKKCDTLKTADVGGAECVLQSVTGSRSLYPDNTHTHTHTQRHPNPPPKAPQHTRTCILVILNPIVCSCLCSPLLVSLVRTNMMVCPSFSQLGKIISLSTDTLSMGLGQLWWSGF